MGRSNKRVCERDVCDDCVVPTNKRPRRRYAVRSPPVNCIPVKKFWVSDVESVGSNDPVYNDAADDEEEVESERKSSVEDLEKKTQQIGRNTVDLRSQLLGFTYILD
nr:hypothetical protein [Tanacetum cinerariifolium]